MSSASETQRVSAVIADDEPVAREGLRALLADVSWLHCVGEASSTPATIEIVDRLRPDVLFLDIEMPGGSGLDVLRQLSHRPYVVFTTAYGQHAVTAFELGAVDYLLKPFGEERLRVALDRVRAALGEPRDSTADRLQEMFSQQPMRRLFVRSGASVIPLAVESLTHLSAWGDYVNAHTTSSRYVLHVALHRLEERLDPTRWVRVHRAHLVNLDHVVAFRPQSGGQLVAEMSSGERVPVSRTHARAVRGLGR